MEAHFIYFTYQFATEVSTSVEFDLCVWPSKAAAYPWESCIANKKPQKHIIRLMSLKRLVDAIKNEKALKNVCSIKRNVETMAGARESSTVYAVYKNTQSSSASITILTIFAQSTEQRIPFHVVVLM